MEIAGDSAGILVADESTGIHSILYTIYVKQQWKMLPVVDAYRENYRSGKIMMKGDGRYFVVSRLLARWAAKNGVESIESLPRPARKHFVGVWTLNDGTDETLHLLKFSDRGFEGGLFFEGELKFHYRGAYSIAENVITWIYDPSASSQANRGMLLEPDKDKILSETDDLIRLQNIETGAVTQWQKVESTGFRRQLKEVSKAIRRSGKSSKQGQNQKISSASGTSEDS